jgi:hypothetical protein
MSDRGLSFDEPTEYPLGIATHPERDDGCPNRSDRMGRRGDLLTAVEIAL